MNSFQWSNLVFGTVTTLQQTDGVDEFSNYDINGNVS